MKMVGVILAGGSGIRFGSVKPKQFMRIAGKRIVEHTLEIFEASSLIDEIAIVTNPGYVEEMEDIVNSNSLKKVKKILLGGKTRNGSSLSAINAYWNEPDRDEIRLVFHDVVRPFVSDHVIVEIHKALNKFNAIDVAIPSTDTIIEVENDKIASIPDRSRLMNGQTPQAFKLDVIKRAYDLAAKDPFFKASDDCGVIKKYLPDEEIFVVKGDETNIKITHELDLFISDKIFQLRHKELFGHVDMSLLKDKVLVIFGGNDGIGAATARLAEKYGVKVFRFSRSLNKVNIKNRSEVKRALESVFSECGRIDYVVNTAAVLHKQPLNLMDYSDIFETLDVNLKGALIVAKESFPYLEKSKGHLLNYTSSSYTRGRGFYSVYSATKAAIVNLTQALAEEWENKGVRVNCINPERTKTPMRERNFGNEPEGSLLKPDEVASESLNTLLQNFTGQVIYVKKINP